MLRTAFLFFFSLITSVSLAQTDEYENDLPPPPDENGASALDSYRPPVDPSNQDVELEPLPADPYGSDVDRSDSLGLPEGNADFPPAPGDLPQIDSPNRLGLDQSDDKID